MGRHAFQLTGRQRVDPLTGTVRDPCEERAVGRNARRPSRERLTRDPRPPTRQLPRFEPLCYPTGSAEGPGDAIRQPVLEPDRDVRPFQDVLLELGYRLGLPGMTTPDGRARYPGGYPDYLVNHERKPGIGPLAGWRGADGTAAGTGAVNPRQLDRYIEHQSFWHHELPPEQLYYKHANRAYLEGATKMGFLDAPAPVVLQLYCEPLQKFRLAARGHGPIQPPEQHRDRVARYFDRMIESFGHRPQEQVCEYEF